MIKSVMHAPKTASPRCWKKVKDGVQAGQGEAGLENSVSADLESLVIDPGATHTCPDQPAISLRP